MLIKLPGALGDEDNLNRVLSSSGLLSWVENGLGLYGVEKVADVIEPLHGVGGHDYSGKLVSFLIFSSFLGGREASSLLGVPTYA